MKTQPEASLMFQQKMTGQCVQMVWDTNALFICKHFVSAPLCPPPPVIPIGGILDVIPAVFEVSRLSSCALDGEMIKLECPTFLSIHVLAVTYGRQAGVTLLCNGEKDKAPAVDCISTDLDIMLHNDCRGKYSCEQAVSPELAAFDNCDERKKELNIDYTCGNITGFIHVSRALYYS